MTPLAEALDDVDADLTDLLVALADADLTPDHQQALTDDLGRVHGSCPFCALPFQQGVR
jgi:hypothetical protein